MAQLSRYINTSMQDKKAQAEIMVDPEKGWLLPTFGSKKPGLFRYWGHVHFENDPRLNSTRQPKHPWCQ